MFIKFRTDKKVNQNDIGLALEADELIYEIQNNPNAIGFCKLSQIIDIGTKDFKSGAIVARI